MCAQFVQDCRKKLWPDYHEMEAKRDEERERLEAEEKKRKAKVGFLHASLQVYITENCTLSPKLVEILFKPFLEVLLLVES